MILGNFKQKYSSENKERASIDDDGSIFSGFVFGNNSKIHLNDQSRTSHLLNETRDILKRYSTVLNLGEDDLERRMDTLMVEVLYCRLLK